MIRLVNVRKVFLQGSQPVAALDGLSLSVPKGEFVAIMGPSGSGKSTLLNLIGGLDTPSEGELWLDGKQVQGLTDDELTLFRRRNIGFIFQFFNLLPTLTASENVALPLLLDGRPREEAGRRAEELLEVVGLSGRREHRPDQLSGGQRQRVAIARALSTKPSLLLADEPTGNLDSKVGAEILELLKESNQRLGLTIAMVTHDAHAAAYGHRIIRLRDGKIVE
ncbi:MAG: ABC transporter ATP-binding protein [Planctomycetes bacterium]|nr:ABC transporter ATP-binding protein [Planctomycetota bacterium]